ncbi:MAG: hypothetical protein QNK35_05490 [Bacteroides sp.]|nr:hypothetical protein [Bacteroides sp.]
MHIDHSLNVMDYTMHKNYKTAYTPLLNSSVSLADCPYFTTRYIEFDQPVEKDYNFIDSFVIYMCMEGNVDIQHPGGESEVLKKGDTIMIPAAIKELSLIPAEKSTLLEIFMQLKP